MLEGEGNPCEFKAVCNFSHKVTDETCGYHLVKNIEDCPLHKFAIRIRKDLAEKVKEEIRKETAVLNAEFQAKLQAVYDAHGAEGIASYVPARIIQLIDDTLLQDGGD